MHNSILLIGVLLVAIQECARNNNHDDYDAVLLNSLDDKPVPNYSSTVSEEEHVDLRARSVPFVINQNEQIEPPKFAASILRKKRLIGSGAIISKHFVLTVCALIKHPGTNTADLTAITRVQYPYFKPSVDDILINSPIVRKLIPHPECGEIHDVNPIANIGLIQTEEPMLESDCLKYPKLPSSILFEGTGTYFLSNFRTKHVIATNIKQAIWFVKTEKVSTDVCERLLQRDRQTYSLSVNFCMAYFHMGGASRCAGDLGLPLSLRKGNEDTLIGLIVHKHLCGRPRELATFIYVKGNVEWIKSVLAKFGK